jgi:hypothetical protein
VGWDVKTDVELECGGDRARNVADPARCLSRARDIVQNHELRERVTFRSYTFIAWSALVPGLTALVLGLLLLSGTTARKRSRRVT